jgi:hypothetical protein
MLLRPGVAWVGVDDASFDVTLVDHGMTTTTRVLLGPDGSTRDTETDDRWCALPGGPVRARWTTPVDGWRMGGDGRPLATRGRAIWHLPDGEYTYAEGSVTVGSLVVNRRPAALRGAAG